MHSKSDMCSLKKFVQAVVAPDGIPMYCQVRVFLSAHSCLSALAMTGLVRPILEWLFCLTCVREIAEQQSSDE